MPDMLISATGWLAISLGNGIVGVFDLNDTSSWQSLQPELSVDQSSNDIDWFRHVIKFSPNGQILVFNGPNRQLNIYIRTDFEQTEVWWQLKQIIIVEISTSAIDLTNEFLLIADRNGDISKVDLALNDDNNRQLILSEEHRIIEHSSMLLDMIFLSINNKHSFILTADQDNVICLRPYPNVSHRPTCGLGHTAFVSHLKLIDNHQILSASGDGTFRLWHLPDCLPLAFLHSKVFTLSTKEIYYSQLMQSEDSVSQENHRVASMGRTSPSHSLSTMDYSIWKMDVASYGLIDSIAYIACSIYAHRYHSIYLTSLSNIKELTNEQRKLTFDSSYGTIVDYCFPSETMLLDDRVTDCKCYLYVLFNSHILLKVDILSIFRCKTTALFEQSDERIQEINNLLASKEFHSADERSDTLALDEIVYKQLFESQSDSSDNPISKRKIERNEEQQRKKPASLQKEADILVTE